MKAKFIVDMEFRIEQIKKNMLIAHEPKTDWQVWNGSKQHELYEEQIKKGLSTANDRLTDVSFETESEIRKNQTEISKKLYPMLNSNYSADRTRGESNRLFSIELVSKLENVNQFHRVYNDTMDQQDVDLCTCLIDAGELKFNLPNDRLLINDLKKAHVETLELNELLVKKEQLKTLKKNVDTLRKQYAVGIVKPLSMAKTADEHKQMMLERGLAV